MNLPNDRQPAPARSCAKIIALLPFHACDELEPAEREAVAAHLSSCSSCSAQLAEERALLDSLAALPRPADRLDPAGTLLAQCRSELAESIDDLAAPREIRWEFFGWFKQLLVFHPAWTAASLLLLGVLAGTQLFRPGPSAQPSGQIVRATPRFTDEQLSRIAVSGISFGSSSGSAPGTVQVQLSAEQPQVLSGSIEDADVRRVLAYVVANGPRFNPGVRLDCLDALKSATADAGVRRAIVSAARLDANPAVRLKAFDVLRDSAAEQDVREALLDALENDANPGVRVEALNLLVASLGENDSPAIALPEPPVPPDPAAVAADLSLARVTRTLEILTRQDPNHYVRLRSQAALRQIGAREIQ
ncbi:MAG: zf-HC2 domain-containing protein [Acidobacteriia bacterium]|nr:zf-HC2 domain-containing protein [Terriglobia bacterium]